MGRSPGWVLMDDSDSTLRLGFVTDIHHDRGFPRVSLAMRLSQRLESACRGSVRSAAWLSRPLQKPVQTVGAEMRPRQSDVVHREGELVELDEHRQAKVSREAQSRF